MTHRYFRFISYDFDEKTGLASFKYGFDDELEFTEAYDFAPSENYNKQSLDNALFYLFIVSGTSYYKLFPKTRFKLEQGSMSAAQAQFFSGLYRGGLGQFIYENKLSPDDISTFGFTHENGKSAPASGGSGLLLMQSGGKDSLLAAELLKQNNKPFDAIHMSSTGEYPEIINEIGADKIHAVKRTIDLKGIKQAQANGGLNGHVPFSAITAGVALTQAILAGKSTVVAAMEASSDEGNVQMGSFTVNHAYSKTYVFEKNLSDYITMFIADDLDYVSAVRPFGDLRIAELFAKHAWDKYSGSFSSCNVANYKQGSDDGKLSWCADCSKCANTFLLFAPFVPYDDLTKVFNGKNLLAEKDHQGFYMQLLGVEGIKPFECVGTVDELRAAYHMAREKDGRYNLDFEVALPVEDFREIGPHSSKVRTLIATDLL